MMFKKVLLVMMTVVCTMAMTPVLGEGAAGLPSPVREVTADEILSEMYIAFPVPEGAQEVAYAIIDMGPESGIAQMQCTLDGVPYCFRAQEGVELVDPSGMFYEWTVENNVILPNGTQVEVRYIDGEAGVVLWYQASMGLSYSVSMDTGATEAALMAAIEPITAMYTYEEDAERMAMAYEVADESWLNVRLEANATTGYEWKYEISNEEMLACDGTDYLPDENAGGLAGVAGTYVAAFSPTMNEAGEVTLTFRYARDFEPEEPPAETYVFTLWITEAGTLSVEGVE